VLLNHAFKQHEASGSHSLQGAGFELFHGYWEVLVRRLIAMTPALDQPRTWSRHYRRLVDSEDNGYVLPLAKQAEDSAQFLKMEPPCNSLDDFVARQGSSKPNCIDLIEGSSHDATVSLLEALQARRSIVIHFGIGNQMQAFDLLVIDWIDDSTPQLTFVQTKFSLPDASTRLDNTAVEKYLGTLRKMLRPYVTESNKLFPGSKIPEDCEAPVEITTSLLPGISGLSHEQVRAVFIAARPSREKLIMQRGLNVSIVDLDVCKDLYGPSLFQLVRVGV